MLQNYPEVIITLSMALFLVIFSGEVSFLSWLCLRSKWLIRGYGELWGSHSWYFWEKLVSFFILNHISEVKVAYKLHSHRNAQQAGIDTWHWSNLTRKRGDVFFEARTHNLALHKWDLVLHLASDASWLCSSGIPLPWYSSWLVE